MTPMVSQSVATMLSRLYPGICKKWTSDEWEVLREELQRIEGVDQEQAEVVLRKYRAENDRPSIKAIVAAIKSARPTVSAGGFKATRNLRVDKYRRDMMAKGWGHNLSDEQVLAHVCRWWASQYGEHSAIEHLIDCAREFTHEAGAFALAQEVFGEAGRVHVNGILERRARVRGGTRAAIASRGDHGLGRGAADASTENTPASRERLRDSACDGRPAAGSTDAAPLERAMSMLMGVRDEDRAGQRASRALAQEDAVEAERSGRDAGNVRVRAEEETGEGGGGASQAWRGGERGDGDEPQGAGGAGGACVREHIHERSEPESR